MTYTDTISPTLRELFKVSHGLGMQSMSKSAAKVATLMKSDARTAGTSEWGMRIKDGHRVIVKRTQPLMQRYDHKTGARLTPMWELIRFKQYPHRSIVLVGFIDTKSYKSLRYVGGIPRPYKRVKGTQTKAIMDRLSGGGKVGQTMKQRQLWTHSGFAAYTSVRYKRHRFMNMMSYFGTVESTAKAEWKLAFKQLKIGA